MIIFLATSSLLVLFQTNIHATSATSTSKTTGQLLDESILKLTQNIQRLTASTQELQNEYQTLKKDVVGLRKLHGSCAPCKASAKDRGACDCTDIEPRKDCLEFYQHGYKISGVYRLQGPGFHIVYVYCDQTTQGGGWTVFQRRQDGLVDFNRNWNDYKHGFGNLEGEFWFGNDNIYDLTKPSFSPKKSQLLINMRMKEQNDTVVYVKYNTFEITDEVSKYILKINGLSGNVKKLNEMDYNNNRKFTTFDNDNGRRNFGNGGSDCASKTKYGGSGGWWYGQCSSVFLNGQYKFTKKNGEIFWDWDMTKVQPEHVEMKMRRNL